MKLKTHITQVILILTLLGKALCAQEYAEDMKKITDGFKKGDISFHIKYLFFPYDSVKKSADSITISCSMSGQDYYCKIISGTRLLEYGRNSKYYFMADHAESAIAVKKSTDVQKQAWDISKIDSLMHVPGVKVSYKNISSNEGQYEISMVGKMWSRCKLTFSKTDYRIEKVCMYSDSKGRMLGSSYVRPIMVMYYSGYSEKKIDKSIFTEDRFFHDTGNEIVLSEAYKKYRLLDYVYKLSGRS
jgi:hypothetical protein